MKRLSQSKHRKSAVSFLVEVLQTFLWKLHILPFPERKTLLISPLPQNEFAQNSQQLCSRAFLAVIRRGKKEAMLDAALSRA